MPQEPFSHDSERVFAEYLDQNQLRYERNVLVNPGNVDFCVHSDGLALCDVKAVEQPPAMHGRVEAHIQIRHDLRSLRRKFEERSQLPCVLVTMNYSPQIFTGHTIRVAMLGDVGVVFGRRAQESAVSPMHHLPRGNAAMTQTHNRSISGILVIDCASNHHAFFANPYAALPLPSGFFPGASEVQIQRRDEADQMLEQADVTFFPSNLWEQRGS